MDGCKWQLNDLALFIQGQMEVLYSGSRGITEGAGNCYPIDGSRINIQKYPMN